MVSLTSLVLGIPFTWLWFWIAIAFAVIEALTLGIVSIWFAIGALVAMLFAFVICRRSFVYPSVCKTTFFVSIDIKYFSLLFSFTLYYITIIKQRKDGLINVKKPSFELISTVCMPYLHVGQ